MVYFLSLRPCNNCLVTSLQAISNWNEMLLTLWGEGPPPSSVEPPHCGLCLPLTCFSLYSDRVSVNFLKRLGLLGWGWNDGKEEKKIASSWQNKDPFSSSFSSPK